MTVTINNDNPNLVILSDNTAAIYFSSEDFLLQDDTLIIQDGRKSETHWNVELLIKSNSKAVKAGYFIANLLLKTN